MSSKKEKKRKEKKEKKPTCPDKINGKKKPTR